MGNSYICLPQQLLLINCNNIMHLHDYLQDKPTKTNELPNAVQDRYSVVYILQIA